MACDRHGRSTFLVILSAILSAIFPFGPGTRVQAEEEPSLIEEVWTWGILGLSNSPMSRSCACFDLHRDR